MGNAVGQMPASAVGVAISPIPLIAVVLMLATPRGPGQRQCVRARPGGGGGAADLPHRVLFLLLAFKQWQGRPREGQEARTPKWTQTIDKFTPGKAGGPAAALVPANRKNLVLVVGGAVSIASSGASAGERRSRYVGDAPTGLSG